MCMVVRMDVDAEYVQRDASKGMEIVQHLYCGWLIAMTGYHQLFL